MSLYTRNVLNLHFNRKIMRDFFKHIEKKIVLLFQGFQRGVHMKVLFSMTSVYLYLKKIFFLVNFIVHLK